MTQNTPATRRSSVPRTHSSKIVLVALLTLLAACSPLRTFNALVPKDRGGQIAARAVAYGAHPRQKLDVYRPATPGSDSGRTGRPTVLFIYGGSWQSGERNGYGFVGRALADRGFVVAIPDYRLVPEVRFPGFLEDNADAFRWVVRNIGKFGGDPSRVVLLGHSAGAYNAAMLTLDPRWLRADRSALAGFVGLAGPYDFLPLSGPVTTAAFGQAGDLSRTQPINFASADDPPSLLLHGAQDTTVYPRNSRRLQERLKQAGADARLRIYPELGHVGIVTAFARPFRGRAPVLEDVAGFVREVSSRPSARPAPSRR